MSLTTQRFNSKRQLASALIERKKPRLRRFEGADPSDDKNKTEPKPPKKPPTQPTVYV